MSDIKPAPPVIQSVSEFIQENNFTAISKVRISDNGYPLVTFLKTVEGKNVGTNVLFSKGAADKAKAHEGKSFVPAVKEQALKIVRYVAEDGEERIKLGRGNLLYDDATSILDDLDGL